MYSGGYIPDFVSSCKQNIWAWHNSPTNQRKYFKESETPEFGM